MTAATLWLCDGCGLEGRDGYPGAPPDGWVRANASIAGHVRSRDRDYCPACATSVDLVALAETGEHLADTRGAAAKGRESKRGKRSKTPDVELDLDDGPVDPDAPADVFTDGLEVSLSGDDLEE